jgi:hypothetical protein
VRAFATAKSVAFLCDAVAKAAIGADSAVAANFVAAFAPVVHRRPVRVANVTSLPATTILTPVRDMKHDIALRYSIGGADSAVMEVMPQHYNRALVEIQQQPETYLPGRALAHASGHYLAAVAEEAKVVKEEKRRAAEEKEASLAASADGATRKSRSKGARAVFDSAIYTAYVRVEPVHLLMLSNFFSVHDTAAQTWRSPQSSSNALDGKKYGWATPLFSTFRFTSDAESLPLVAGLENPGLSPSADALENRLSITIVHLPMVPSALDDEAAWRKAVALPEHHVALESAELRQWLHYLAHTTIKDGKVEMPAELRANPIFKKSAEQAETLFGSSPFTYSEKDMADAALQSERELAHGRKEGEERGRKEGEERGQKDGEERGRKEGRAALAKMEAELAKMEAELAMAKKEAELAKEAGGAAGGGKQ